MKPDPQFDAILSAPFGALGVRVRGDRLAELVFLPPGTTTTASPSPFITQTQRELERYYSNPEHRFELPLFFHGTPFREKVWRALENIPAGSTVTYGDIAKQLGSAPRAVGQAVGDNPLPIIIPCHRVIAADGGLGGFNHSRIGYTQDIKRWLLSHEGAL